jgi:predicted nucleic acid-binding protein
VTLILDASIWLAALDPDDGFHESSRSLVHGDVTALDLTLYEVANVATVRWSDPASARDVCELVLDACDVLIRIDQDLLEETIAVSAHERITVYDAAYVAAAAREGYELVSADFPDLVNRGLAKPPDYFFK